MKTLLLRLKALPLERLDRNPDLVLALGVSALVITLILPLPPSLIDVLLAINLTLSAVILASVLVSEKAIAVSTFPTLLLLTTLFRLALNVSTTRLILSTGEGGDVVETFGHFVLGGDLIVGIVMFAVITVVQMLVLAKGAERVAEVGARFTLDAMPGKQMAIDAAVRAGSLTEEQGQDKREELGRESQFYGAMDGAMKFIKGDAIAGLLITAINMFAGMALGVLRFDLSISMAAERYSTLSIGDALVSQIPALLITLAAALVTTRVAAKEHKNNLGNSLRAELLGSWKALAVGSVFTFGLALLPGLPIFAFCAIGTALGLAARNRYLKDQVLSVQTTARQSAMNKIEARTKQAKAQRSIADRMAPSVVPVSIDLGVALSKALGFTDEETEGTELIAKLIPELREALYVESGVRFPGVRVRSNAPAIETNSFMIRLREVPMIVEKLDPDRVWAIEAPDRLRRFGVDVSPVSHPLTGAEIGSVPAFATTALRASGVAVWTPAGAITLTLAKVLRANAKDFVGLQETSEMIEKLEKAYPALVKEVVPRIVSMSQLAELLRRLVDEGVSIRDMKTVFESLAQFGPHQTDGVALTELVRGSLSMQIGHAHAGLSGRLSAVLLDPMIEDTIRGSIAHTAGGSYLALDPELRNAILDSVNATIAPIRGRGIRAVVLTTAEIRRYVHKLLEGDFPGLSVLSFQELPPKMTVHPLGRVQLTPPS
jgi:type III secretion protein V